MALPANFEAQFEEAEKFGLLEEDAETAERRARLAIESAPALAAGAAKLGAGDWAARMLRDLEAAVHEEICAKDGSGLDPTYVAKLNGALTKDGIAQVATVVLQVAKAVHPGLVVSSVGLYVAIWLLKIGLNSWCKTPERGATA